MKLIEATAEKLVFQLKPKEKASLVRVLGLYPLVPLAHQRFSKATPRAESQQLLNETLISQHRENKELIVALIDSGVVFREHEGGWRFALRVSQVEWLLQVLNDVRVGSWLIIGSPDGPAELVAALNERTAPYFWVLQMADHFQIALLHALHGGGATPDAEE